MPPMTIRSLDAAEAEARIAELATVLCDAVAHGASVNFLAGLDGAAAAQWWRGSNAGLSRGERLLFVAEQRGRIVGTVLLMFAQQPNQPHRAEIGKMLVLSESRRRGIGKALLAAAEAHARMVGRTLLVLDTEEGSAGDHLYARSGWTPFGVVPGYALTTDGRPAAAKFFYKTLT